MASAAPRINYQAGGRTGWPWDESEVAALVAQQRANIAHVVIRPEGITMLQAIRETIRLGDRAPLNPANAVWDQQINADAQRRGAGVILTGQMGNLTISFDGMTRLDALARSHDWFTLARELMALPLSHRSRIAFLLRSSLPKPLWDGLKSSLSSKAQRFRAIRPEIEAQFAAKQHRWPEDVKPRSSYEWREFALFRVDHGSMHAASLAGWGIESRDPTADRRIIDFCLSLPDDQYLRNGITRWLFRRAFGQELPKTLFDVNKLRKGRQAADYHLELASCRDEYLAQLDLFERSSVAARVLDIAYMRGLLHNMPDEGWNNYATESNYRAALLRGFALGMFILSAEAGHA